MLWFALGTGSLVPHMFKNCSADSGQHTMVEAALVFLHVCDTKDLVPNTHPKHAQDVAVCCVFWAAGCSARNDGSRLPACDGCSHISTC